MYKVTQDNKKEKNNLLHCNFDTLVHGITFFQFFETIQLSHSDAQKNFINNNDIIVT